MAAPSNADSLGRVLRVGTLLLAGGALLTFGLTLAGRLWFPWPLEWMEGASLQHALRLLHGQPVYALPTAEFIAYLYPPLAYVPMAISVALFGPTLAAARLPSLVCTLLSLWLIGRAAARAAEHPLAGWLAAGMFALGFGYCGAFLDLARVDACFVMLVLAGAERLHAGRPRSALCWLALSAFAKQHGLLLLLGACAGLLRQDAKRHRIAVGAAVATVLLAFAALELATGGWLGRYALALPASQPVVWSLLPAFFLVDLLLYLPVLVLSAGLSLRRRTLPQAPLDALLVAALLASALGRAHAGGHDNVRLPAFALLCITGCAPLCRWMLSSTASARARILAFGALAVQLAMLWQAPSLHRPPAQSAPEFAALRATLARCAGGGSAVALDYALLGGQPFLHTMALSDLRMGGDRALARMGTEVLLHALSSPKAPAALAVGERFAVLQRVLERNYHECARLPAPELATGYRPGLLAAGERIQIVYARNEPPASGHASVGPEPRE
jgi:hypothetical protein